MYGDDCQRADVSFKFLNVKKKSRKVQERTMHFSVNNGYSTQTARWLSTECLCIANNAEWWKQLRDEKDCCCANLNAGIRNRCAHCAVACNAFALHGGMYASIYLPSTFSMWSSSTALASSTLSVLSWISCSPVFLPKGYCGYLNGNWNSCKDSLQRQGKSPQAMRNIKHIFKN